MKCCEFLCGKKLDVSSQAEMSCSQELYEASTFAWN